MRSTILSVLVLLVASSAALAAAPAFSGTWVNGDPLKVESLKGKVTVLWFYEEGCPRCREKWPSLVATADSFKDEPVVFIAVNSGNDSKAVEGYLKSVNCSWRAIADQDRSFEKAAKVGVISTSNIYQMKVITPDGNLVGGDWNNIEGTVKSHLAKAKWKVDPKIVPEPMKTAWKSLEFGDYNAASAMVKKSIASKDEKTKTAAEAMQKAITDDLESLMAAAAAEEKASHKWEAYKLYDQAADNFKGQPKATEATAAVKRLGAEKDLKDEIAAMSKLDKARVMLSSRNRQERRAADGIIDSIAKDYPSTEAGAIAADMIKSRTATE